MKNIKAEATEERASYEAELSRMKKELVKVKRERTMWKNKYSAIIADLRELFEAKYE